MILLRTSFYSCLLSMTLIILLLSFAQGKDICFFLFVLSFSSSCHFLDITFCLLKYMLWNHYVVHHPSSFRLYSAISHDIYNGVKQIVLPADLISFMTDCSWIQFHDGVRNVRRNPFNYIMMKTWYRRHSPWNSCLLRYMLWDPYVVHHPASFRLYSAISHDIYNGVKQIVLVADILSFTTDCILILFHDGVRNVRRNPFNYIMMKKWHWRHSSRNEDVFIGTIQ